MGNIIQVPADCFTCDLREVAACRTLDRADGTFNVQLWLKSGVGFELRFDSERVRDRWYLSILNIEHFSQWNQQ